MPPKKSKHSLTVSSIGDLSSDKSDSEEGHLFTSKEEAFFLRITKTISASFERCMERLITDMDTRISRRIDATEVSVFDVKNRLDLLEQKCKKLSDENSELKTQIVTLKLKNDQLELNQDDLDQYSRSKNVLIHGIPVSSDESLGSLLEDRVLSELNGKLGLNLSSADLTAAHRNGPTTQHSNIGIMASRPAPILLQFLRRVKKNQLLTVRKNLKGSGISVSEQLTAKRVKLLAEANDMQKASKLTGAWAHDGKILIKAPDGSTKVIRSSSDLNPFR
jgi:hypothetical protein